MIKFLDKLFGDPNERELKKLQPVVEKVNALEKDFEKLKDNDLPKKTEEFKQRLTKGEKLDDLLPEAFALVREAAKRTLRQRHFDVQLLGGIILHQGKIAEMKTGEGKTLVATLPLYLNALTGKGAHLVTVNDYLARRDANWMGPVYNLLGLSVGIIQNLGVSYRYQPGRSPDHPIIRSSNHPKEEQPQAGIVPDMPDLIPCSRQEAYHCDITYGTNNEFGFDYLRDNMVYDLSQKAQKAQYFAIVDEVDSILIDEARTPLIISAPAEESAQLYQRFASLVPQLKKDTDYQVDEKMHAVTLTDAGMKKMEGLLGLSNIYEPKNVSLVHHLEQALKAHVLYQKDRDYVIKAGEIIIVDEFTGRLMPGRRYSEGLHQAIEAKEGVEVKRESDTLATISFQNLFRMYDKLAGMTGTALTEAEEFYKIYKLDVVTIPTNKPMIRTDTQDMIYKTEEAKFQAAANRIKELYEEGRPVLVGTLSIEKSERLSRLLRLNGVKHEILNAKHHEREAKIIAQAGRPGAVTVATNMAGRGVDIILGGNPPKPGDAEKVLEGGGLHVIGTERHEARRIDNQLRGRSGRQGDPGYSQFFVSLEDDLMRIFGGDRIKGMMKTLHLPDDQPITHSLISRAIESAQKKVEGHNFDIRKHLVEYDDVQNKHREAIYGKRMRILQSKGKRQDGADCTLHEEITSLLNDEEQKKYEEKYETTCKKYGEKVMADVEKMVYLRTIDAYWIEHLNAMEELRQGIGLRGYGQHDPLVAFQQESYNLFQRLKGAIEAQVVEILLKLEVAPAAQTPTQSLAVERQAQLQGADETMAAGTFEGGAQPQPVGVTAAQPTPAMVTESAPASSSGVEVVVRQRGQAPAGGQPAQTSAFPKVGRNEPCPCGAKKSDGRPVKYKHCHGR